MDDRTLKSEFSSSAITIDIHLFDPAVDRSIAGLEECRLEWFWISNPDTATEKQLQRSLPLLLVR